MNKINTWHNNNSKVLKDFLCRDEIFIFYINFEFETRNDFKYLFEYLNKYDFYNLKSLLYNPINKFKQIFYNKTGTDISFESKHIQFLENNFNDFNDFIINEFIITDKDLEEKGINDICIRYLINNVYNNNTDND